MGGDPEKLLTLEEAARRLGIGPDAVEQMIRQGRLASFRLGGDLLRVRLGDVERLRAPSTAGRAPSSRSVGVSSRPRGGLGRLWDRVLDFFYFNDFYLVALLILLTLLAVILTL
ncbi:MAG: helix-turn-helix domain-containing protein [Candidatus Omnitrophica bacterium]|nr:helix-turn-helix domain-containing protein [Candidatus Omnitrophota bacterium]